MDNNSLPEIISINQLCSLMGISRSRYYQILSEGLILPPTHSDSQRPYFTKEMALRNLEVKKNNIGVNGKICIFYNSRDSPVSSRKNITPKNENKKKPTDKYTDLIEGLSSLGIDEVSNSQIEKYIRKCFPNGVDNVDDGEVLRQVFCLIKAQNTTDNENG